MYQKSLTVFLALMGIIFLGSGITGFATLGDAPSVCSDDSDCRYSVCCALADSPTGVCAQPEQCRAIYEGSVVADPGFAPEARAEQGKQSTVAILLGVILLIAIGIVSYVEWHQEKLHPAAYAKSHGTRLKKKKSKK